ncbi:hypothetical protein N657DRAFT_638901 [Parathielavia appendiculata]|uniref:Uncharacterized protein n=1 Tax=Parathielavia appendiculata TaxID=2587402 RepID=A0AAN6U8J9_9PEZI|nr:hypothetical protein N657DRAFT_638901 [Parathielavia appendiculata]
MSRRIAWLLPRNGIFRPDPLGFSILVVWSVVQVLKHSQSEAQRPHTLPPIQPIQRITYQPLHLIIQQTTLPFLHLTCGQHLPPRRHALPIPHQHTRNPVLSVLRLRPTLHHLKRPIKKLSKLIRRLLLLPLALLLALALLSSRRSRRRKKSSCKTIPSLPRRQPDKAPAQAGAHALLCLTQRGQVGLQLLLGAHRDFGRIGGRG